MKIRECALDGILIIDISEDVFRDHRGKYIELYNQALYEEAGINLPWVQDDISVSTKHVLRGIHGDYKTWKLVSCLYGDFLLVVVNNIPGSSQYHEHVKIVMMAECPKQILIPPGFGNAHLVLSDQAIFHYKQTEYYGGADSQFTLKWNDPELKIWWPWPDVTPILSDRDK